MAGKRSQSTPRHPRSPLARQQRVQGHVKTIGPAGSRPPLPGSQSRHGGVPHDVADPDRSRKK